MQVAACPRLLELAIVATETLEFKANLQKLTKFGAVNQYIAFNEGLIFVDDIQLLMIYDNLKSTVSPSNEVQR